MWLFGYGRNNQNPADLSNFGLANPNVNVPGGSDGGGQGHGNQGPGLTSAERKAMEAYRFDSSALERAAAAARDLEKSSKYNFIT